MFNLTGKSVDALLEVKTEQYLSVAFMEGKYGTH